MAYVELIREPEAPAGVVSRIKQIDQNLDLKFIEFPPDQEGNKPRWWAVIYQWPKEDSRRKTVGEYASYDVLGYLPLDCGVTDSYTLIHNMMYQSRNNPGADHLLKRVTNYNKSIMDATLAPVIERAEELIEANATHLFAKETGKTVPKIFMNGGK